MRTGGREIGRSETGYLPKLLFILSVYLFAWIPANFAMLALRSLPSLGVRGTIALVEFSVHGIVAIACATAGWMLRSRNPAGRQFATAALSANAAATIQALATSSLPHDVQPGLAAPLIALSILNATAWIAYLYTSKRVEAWLEN